MDSKDNVMVCDNCGKECDSLVTREGFIMTYCIEWVCKSCFCSLENISFEDFSEGDLGE